MPAKVVDITEKHLVTGCQNGNRASQKELYEKYYQAMFWVCYRYIKDKSQCEDLVHEGFMKIFRNIGAFKFQGSLEGWMKRIMINTCLDFIRKQSRGLEDVPLSKAESKSVDEGISAHLEAEYILECVQRLPDLYRAVFNLNVVEGYPHKEIASMLNIKSSTSRAYLTAAKKILRSYLSEVEPSFITLKNG